MDSESVAFFKREAVIRMKRRREEMLLFSLFLSGVIGGGWVTAGFAEDSLLTLFPDTLDRRVGHVFSMGRSEIPGTTLVTPVQTQLPVERAEESLHSGHHLSAVPGMMMSGSTRDAGNFALDPVGTLVPSRILQETQALDRDVTAERSQLTSTQH
jgi:hypothetical protein